MHVFITQLVHWSLIKSFICHGGLVIIQKQNKGCVGYEDTSHQEASDGLWFDLGIKAWQPHNKVIDTDAPSGDKEEKRLFSWAEKLIVSVKRIKLITTNWLKSNQNNQLWF